MDHKKSTMYPKRGKRRSVLYERVLYIDPGLEGTGWAFYKTINTKERAGQYVKPVESGVVRPSDNLQWQGKVEALCTWLRGTCAIYSPKVVVIEYPETWAGSAKSMASTSSGALGKLMYLVGGLGEVARRVGANQPVLVTPKEWKGQLPKEVVIKRLEKRCGIVKVRNHEGDALGMGLAAQGGL